MALFGSDRPVMPSFKTSPELDSAARSPYDDLNRLERNVSRNLDRDPERNGDRSHAEIQAKELLERVLAPERNGHGNDPERNGDARNGDRASVRELERAVAAAKPAVRRGLEGNDPLIEGLFSKLPEPGSSWPLQARQKWLQTAANIFDLMYAASDGDGGELAIRVERNTAR